MAVSVLRKITSEDWERVCSAAARFCIVRNIAPWDVVNATGEWEVDYYSAVLQWVDANDHYYGDRAGVRAWRRAFARALRVNESKDLTLAYGYVGLRCS